MKLWIIHFVDTMSSNCVFRWRNQAVLRKWTSRIQRRMEPCLSRRNHVQVFRSMYSTTDQTKTPVPSHEYESRKLQRPRPRPGEKAIGRLNVLLQDALQILDSKQPPTEAEVTQSLATCEDLAKYFKKASAAELMQRGDGSPAANLLFLDEDEKSSMATPESPTIAAPQIKDEAIEKISTAAWNIIKDPKVFISSKALKTYVNIQSTLERPTSLGEAFALYAQKPTPKAGTFPIQYLPASPDRITSAVPIDVAKTALDSAIDAQNLPLCLEIINKTTSTTSFRRRKFVQRALLPLTGFSLAPLAAYSAASELSVLQNTMNDDTATNIAFAGIISYVGFTAALGVVALTTANDQMQRVTWTTGTPLRERWLREDERAMFDRVACAWGFKEPWKRGEEESSDWESLRGLIGLRGMVLDAVNLMEGME